MKTDQAKRKYLTQYQPPDFTILRTDLEFELEDDLTRVSAQLTIKRNTHDSHAPLVLDGVGLHIVDLQIDETFLDDSDYSYDGETLHIDVVPDEFDLISVVEIDPAANKSLEGLYLSNGNYCTQCEAEGFRHITFYIDRPDVMSVFTTTIRADRAGFPVMLSNGNLVESGKDGDGHWVKWHDPHPKPCYLFALVAGDLACVEGEFTTKSGHPVALEFYTEQHNADKCDHALESLKKAMRWDEEVFGLEYDLARYMVVAVDDFNMGAMENKGLNVFNTKYVLANPQTATDIDYLNIEGVIAHEYFHNWTGNRVTCRDWFQLSLKEGLTVFRDQEFSSDMNSRAIQRIGDVRVLRAHQFTEDAGPMAHPVRPASYQEINNFYTVTVYNKGAEVVRMYHTLLGADGFRKGMDLYFERHDGEAVTTDDFRLAMQDANRYDLDQFQRWYDQAGTPRVSIERVYDAEHQHLSLWVRQQPGQTREVDNQPFLIPMRLALFSPDGNKLALDADGNDELVLRIDKDVQTFNFDGIEAMPLVSAFRGFSAPVIVSSDLEDAERASLMMYDDDPFNRWDAGQQYATRILVDLIENPARDLEQSIAGLLDALDGVLSDSSIDPSLLAEMLSLPGEKYLAEQMSPVDVQRIHEVREAVRGLVAGRFEQVLVERYQQLTDDGEYQVTPQAVGQRALKNICLNYLTKLGREEYLGLAQQQYDQANNMTDQMGALAALADHKSTQRDMMFDTFYRQWKENPLVVDKWFSAQAMSTYQGVLDEIFRLESHEAFNLQNPNRARSLIGAMQANPVAFHDPSGRGYQFLADKILQLDRFNPQVASRMASGFLVWKKLVPEQGELMKAQLERIQGTAGLSADVSELVESALDEQA
jgi:aminopeptidase N